MSCAGLNSNLEARPAGRAGRRNNCRLAPSEPPPSLTFDSSGASARSLALASACRSSCSLEGFLPPLACAEPRPSSTSKRGKAKPLPPPPPAAGGAPAPAAADAAAGAPAAAAAPGPCLGAGADAASPSAFL